MNKTFFALAILFLTIGAFAQTQPPTPKEILSGVVNGKAINLVKPDYPELSQNEKPAGEVKVQVTIDEQGNIISAKAVSGHPALYQVSEKAALASKFSPTILGGKPVKVSGTIVYKFNPTENYEEKLKFMGLGIFFSMAKIIPMEEWGEPLSEKEFTNEPFLKEILLPLTKINTQTNLENRLKILSQVQNSLEKTLMGDAVWQYELGKEFGGIMTEIAKINYDHTAKFDEPTFKNHLSKMKTLLPSAPADFPANLLIRFKEIVNSGETENLNSDEARTKFAQHILETLNLISPDIGN